MSTKLSKLSRRFADEENVVGERLATAVEEYMTSFLENLKNDVVQETRTKSRSINEVVNAICDIDDEKSLAKKNMFPIIDKKDYPIICAESGDAETIDRLNKFISRKNKGVSNNLSDFSRMLVGYVFLDMSYSEVKKIANSPENAYILNVVSSNGDKYDVRYHMSWSNAIVNQCKKIWNMSKLYGSEKPIVYAPYSTRLFRVEINSEDLPELNDDVITDYSLNLKDNDLSGKIIFNKELVWNVKVEDGGLDCKKTRKPVGDIVIYDYEFTGLMGNQYIIPDRQIWPTLRVDEKDNDIIRMQLENWESEAFEKVTIYKIDYNDFGSIEIFKVNYNKTDQRTQDRIRSLADINYELNKYDKLAKIAFCEVSQVKSSDYIEVTKYDSEMSIYDKGRFGYKNRNNIYLKFTGESTYTFFEDYINFVVNHMTFLYPEIGWKGVY